MYSQNLKSNINKLDMGLQSFFEKIDYDHKEDSFITNVIVESNKIKLITTFDKRELDKSKTFNWSYSINPLNENATIIKRQSSVDTFGKDLNDIIVNKRMDSDYINECLNESFTSEERDEMIETLSTHSNFELEDLAQMTDQELRDLYDSQEIDDWKEELAEEDEMEYQIGESIVFTDYAYNEHKGIIEKKISMTIQDKVYPAWLIKTDEGEEKKVMSYDIKRPAGMPKWWNN
jgi:hypothetical protein